MTVRLLLVVAFVANVLVLAICTVQTSQATAASVSTDNATSSPSSSHASSSSSAKSGVTSKPVKCRKIKKCPKNEEFSYCPQSIQRAQYCSEKAEPSTYRSQLDKPCKEGCVCKENYLRAENGTCIPAEQCSLTCGANEVLVKCPSFCESDSCPMTEADTFAKPCLSQTRCPPPVCTCTFNHHRAANGTCIPTRECPPFDCSHKSNEKYNACPPICPSDDCSQASPTGECPPQFGSIGIVLPCNPRCRCIEGYWKLDGICVPYGQCPGVCPVNERYSTCVQAECRALNCTQKDQSVPCIRLDPKYCEKGCVCQEGYLRNQNGICVLEDKCEPTCPANEEYVQCMQGVCRAKDCSERGQDVPCPDIPPEQCDSGCICKEGFLREGNGSCVPKDQCETISCPVHEEFSECSQAVCRPQQCKEKNWPLGCPGIVAGDCIQGCICEEGYLRDERGVCIPDNECTPNPCQPNEEYSSCIQAICRTLDCSDKGLPIFCPLVAEGDCLEGCVCEEGYLRAEDGYCIPEQQCNAISCPVDEEFSECTQAVCRAQQCKEKNWPIGCPSIAAGYCLKGCICEEGYLRDERGVCIPDNECTPNPCQPNEEFSSCIQATCRTLNCSDKGKPQFCPMVAEGDCLEGCVCEEGYLRTEDGYCVPEQQCDAYKCSLFEQWHECANAVCKAKFCTQKGLPVPCPSVSECVPGCLCQDNYLRHESGFCVPEEECTTHVCPANEEWSTCAQATCRAQNCTQSGKPVPCPMIVDGFCEKACVCKEGYLRNVDGDCIPEYQCPCGENEVLDDCPMMCNTDYCPLSADVEQVCTQADPCVPACKCRFNYKRAQNGTCIPTGDCPPFDCSAKSNEEFVACPPYCPTDECGKPRLDGHCPFRIGVVLKCNPKCQCKDGYGRVNGTCVPFEECPNLCPTNEVYSPCVQQTCRPQNCSDRDLAMETCPTCKADECQRGCVCQKNYYRNDKGDCISYEECGVSGVSIAESSG